MIWSFTEFHKAAFIHDLPIDDYDATQKVVNNTNLMWEGNAI